MVESDPAPPEERPPPADGADDRKSQRKAFLLRLPPDLHAELRGWAAQELRSLNGHIEFLLRQAVVRRKGSGESEDRG